MGTFCSYAAKKYVRVAVIYGYAPSILKHMRNDKYSRFWANLYSHKSIH